MLEEIQGKRYHGKDMFNHYIYKLKINFSVKYKI